MVMLKILQQHGMVRVKHGTAEIVRVDPDPLIEGHGLGHGLAVGLGQPIDLHDIEPDPATGLEDRRRRRRPGGEHRRGGTRRGVP